MLYVIITCKLNQHLGLDDMNAIKIINRDFILYLVWIPCTIYQVNKVAHTMYQTVAAN